MYSVVIVDNHVLLSQGIAGLVNSFDEFQVNYTCSNGRELLSKLESSLDLPEIVLMDVNMPILNGIEATKALTKLYPSIRVIALSIEAKEDTVIAMLKAGAKGYLLKDVKISTLHSTLLEVIKHGFYYDQYVANILTKSLKDDNQYTPAILKKRELEFIKYACSELTYKEIADKMYLSPKTIDGYRSNLFQKLHAKNRVGLVLYAIKNKIFTP
nr:response regulator transcription factor [uncultured Psychroserpens sp.]